MHSGPIYDNVAEPDDAVKLREDILLMPETSGDM
jgi:hypothetical protein